MKYQELKKYNSLSALSALTRGEFISVLDLLVYEDVSFTLLGEPDDINSLLDEELNEDQLEYMHSAIPVEAEFEDGKKRFLVWS